MLKERVLSKILKTESCWLWIGAKYVNGYGVIAYPHRKVQMLAHRASWIAHVGPIPDGLKVLHKCDIPACVRPDHLFLGTQRDNVADMHAKGRAVPGRGSRHARSKLTDAAVLEIRGSDRLPATLRALAEKHGVHERTVQQVAAGRSWRHVSMERA